jgi:hypothetical protein
LFLMFCFDAAVAGAIFVLKGSVSHGRLCEFKVFNWETSHFLSSISTVGLSRSPKLNWKWSMSYKTVDVVDQ